MKNDDVKHDGHRKRLLDLANDVGVDNLSNVQIVEFMLTYIFPRGDVNPLAHRLLDAYGTLSGIFDAEVCDLMTISGINERSAKKIKLLKSLLTACASSRAKTLGKVSKVADIINIVEDMLRHQTTENMVFLSFNKAGRLCGQKRIRAMSQDTVAIPILELTSFLSSTKPTTFVIAHCHPYGEAYPSQADFSAFSLVEKLCFDCGIRLLDSYIVGENGIYSFRENRLVREYYDSELLNRNIAIRG